MQKKQPFFRWVQLCIGALIFAVMFYVHVRVKDLPVELYLIPGVLLGADPSKLFKK